MKLKAGKKTIENKQLAKASATNNFPDLLFFASGKVATPGAEAKFRIKLTDGSETVKKWSEKVVYTQDFGNMFESKLLKDDDIVGEFAIQFEINTGSGWQALDPVDAQEMQGGPIYGQVVIFDNGSGVTGTVGLLLMI